MDGPWPDWEQSDFLSFAESSTAAFASNPPRQPSPLTPRRRRIGRTSRHMHQARSSTSSLDSDTPEPSPATRMQFKRKASSPSAISGRSYHVGSKSASTGSSSVNTPLIRASDVLGNATMEGARLAEPQSPSSRLIVPRNVSPDDSSDDDVDMLAPVMTERNSDYLLNTLEGPQREFPDIEYLVRANEDAAKRTMPTQFSSAMLVMPEEDSQKSGTTANRSENVRYLPLVRMPNSKGRQGSIANAHLTILGDHRERIRHSNEEPTMSKARWPLNDMPVELFDLITTHLSRDDVKSMRLVNKEFERKVSRSLFHTSVVPFNTELYDMIDEDKRNLTRVPRIAPRSKGKQKAGPDDQLVETEGVGLMWQNAKEDKEGKVYKGHGLRVFQGFGPYIKRFGMTFEVSEKQLARPPIKKELDNIDSYHGTYDWPSIHYARFANLAGLENTADETSRMKAAFSNLEMVKELALSIDSGLGWLNGPDKSLRSRIFEQPSPVFGTKYNVLDRSTAASTEFWDAMSESQQSFQPYSNLTEVSLDYRSLEKSTPSALDGIGESIYSDSHRWSSIDQSKVIPTRSEQGLTGLGVLFTTSKGQTTGEIDLMGSSLVPSSLRKEQKEWLLETQWAQQAFLESYMLAVIDNANVFQKVKSLTITKLSSRFLPMLAREVFWEALPHLTNVTLHVSADWRTVEKDTAGLASVKPQNPSEAVRVFYRDILRDRISNRESIRKLDVGWYGGGEQAQGMHARNSNLLPAPISQLDHTTANSSAFGLVFIFVEHLTLSNCWISPPALEGLVRSHAHKALKKLTLNSVSLTAHPRFPPVNAQGGAALQLAQAAMAWQGPLANGAQPPALPQQPVLQPGQAPQVGFAQHIAQLVGPAFLQGANPQQMAVLHQQWNQHVQNMQQLFANPAGPNPNVPQPNGLNQHGPLMGGAPNAANPNLINPAQQGLHAQAAAVAAVAGAQATANAPHSALPGPAWIHGHREGSWPQIIDTISPGPVFNDYLPAPKPWEEPLPPRPQTNLRTIEFVSCGYAKLPNHNAFDQLVLEPDMDHVNTFSPWFRARWTNLKPLVLESRDRHLGQIMQFIRDREMDALQFGWGLTEGWSDQARAREAQYDGLLPGGTGRFSGTIEHGMPLVG